MKYQLFTFFTIVMLGLISLGLAKPVIAEVNPPIPNEDLLGLQYGEETGLGNSDLRSTVARIINVILSLLGIIFIVLTLYSGFTWMTAGGNESKAETARKILFSAVIGLVIILSAYTLTNFVLRSSYKATTGYDYALPGNL